MLDEKDLQAIAALMDAKLEPIKKDLDALRADMATKKELKETEGRMIALMEAHFDPKFDLLADGHALLNEQMVKKSDLTEALEDIRIQAGVLEAITQKNLLDIMKLKSDLEKLKKPQ